MAKYLTENEFSETLKKKKTIGSIHFIPGIYPYRVSLLTHIHFQHYGGQIFDWKWYFLDFLKKLLPQFISNLVFILMGWVPWSLFIFVFIPSILPPGGQIVNQK